MPNPINGQGQAQAATQVRIINLSPAIPTAITGDAVVAIDLPNETYKLTLDELVNFAGLDNYLPLAGGVMTGDITLSNSLSVNTVAENADRGYSGKQGGQTISDFDVMPNYSCNFSAGSGSTPNRPPNAAGSHGWHLVFDSDLQATFVKNLSNNALSLRTKSAGVWGEWSEIATFDPATGGFLPLEGGTLTGDNSVLVSKADTINSPVYNEFQEADGARLGLIGKAESQNDISIISDLGNIKLSTSNGSIDLIDAGGEGLQSTPLIQFLDSVAARQGYVGFGSSSAQDLILLCDFGSMQMQCPTGQRISLVCESNLYVDANGTSTSSDITAFRGLPNEVSMSELTIVTGGNGTAASPYFKYHPQSKTVEYFGSTGSIIGNGQVNIDMSQYPFVSNSAYMVQCSRLNDGSNNLDSPTFTKTSASACAINNVNSDPITADFYIIGFVS